MDPFGDDIFLYGSSILLSLDCFWKLLIFAKFRCLHRSHALACVLDPLLQIDNFFPLTIIYMRELIAAGGRRDNSGAPNYGFLLKVHWKRLLDYI